MLSQSSENKCLYFHIRKADRHLCRVYDFYLRPCGLKITQFGMLHFISCLANPFISDLGRALGMDQSTVTRNVDKLVKSGLLIKKNHPDDPRKKLVCITTKGIEKLRIAQTAWREAQEFVKNSIGEAKMNEMLELLNIIMGIHINGYIPEEGADNEI